MRRGGESRLFAYRARTLSVEVLFAVAGSDVELVTWAVLVIQPPPFPVMVVVTVNETLAPLASDEAVHVTTRVADA
jgi:hypothetical protein